MVYEAILKKKIFEEKKFFDTLFSSGELSN
jgi:hypothetical protein